MKARPRTWIRPGAWSRSRPYPGGADVEIVDELLAYGPFDDHDYPPTRETVIVALPDGDLLHLAGEVFESLSSPTACRVVRPSYNGDCGVCGRRVW